MMVASRVVAQALLLIAVSALSGACGGASGTATVVATSAPVSASTPASSPPAPTTTTVVPVVTPRATATPASSSTVAPLTTVAASPPAAAPTMSAVPSTVEVKIVDFAFEPATLTIPVGASVVWTNTGVQHTVFSTQPVRLLFSPVLEKGDTYRFTFTRPGTYTYVCSLHPDMMGQIVVQ